MDDTANQSLYSALTLEQTWWLTPNTSSCPMCRRDLAILACIRTMVDKQEEALPLWMAL